MTLRILPFSAGAHPAMVGPFTALRFPDDDKLTTVYVELDGGAVYLERPADVARYSDRFNQLVRLAGSEKDTATLLGKAARTYQGG